MTAFLLGLAVALAVTGLAVPVLTRAGVWDVANARSSHTGAVPRGGGLGVMAGLVAGALSSSSDLGGVGWTVLAWALLMAAIGLLDDFRGMPVGPRLAAQLVLALAVAVVLGRSQVSGWVVLGYVAIGAVWLVSYVNAFNFMDGINGISALSGAVASGWYAWVGHRVDAPELTVLGLALGGACLGFLPWNAPRARVFLGDVGSYGIGAAIAALALFTWLRGAGLAFALAPVVLYLADTATVLLKRAARGESLGAAHREHVYQKLVLLGWSHVATAVVVGAAAAIICLGVAVLSTPLSIGLAVVLVVGYLALPALVGRKQKVA